MTSRNRLFHGASLLAISLFVLPLHSRDVLAACTVTEGNGTVQAPMAGDTIVCEPAPPQSEDGIGSNSNQTDDVSVIIRPGATLTVGEDNGDDAIFLGDRASITVDGDIISSGKSAINVRDFADIAVSGDIISSGKNGILARDGLTLLLAEGGSIEETDSGSPAINTRNDASIVVGGSLRSNGGPAIEFDGTGGQLTLLPTYSITGTVTSSSSFELVLGGSGIGTFDGSLIDPTSQFQDVSGLTKTGLSAWTLNGTSSFAGPVLVESGTLIVDGSIASANTTVTGGALQGTGTLGSTSIGAGGTIAPGNSVGTLSVEGDLNFVPGAIYAVEIEAGGASDLIEVRDTATLGGGSVVVSALDQAVSYQDGQRYTILTSGTRVGEFSAATMANQSAFLRPALAYDGGTVSLLIDTIQDEPPVVTPPAEPTEPPSVTPPAAPRPLFGTVAQTSNQRATAGGLDTLAQSGESLSLYNAILFSNAENARAAFDQLSGETHASVSGALVETSGAARDAVASRIESLFSVESEGADLPSSDDRFLSSGVWLDGFGTFGRADGDGNAARADRDIGGVFFGGDRTVSPNATLGLFGGYTHTSVNARNGSADADTVHVGGYGAAAFGAVELSGSASFSWNEIDTTRTVAFPGFSDSLTADYDAGTTQVFGEAGYRTLLGGVGLKPFVALAYVHLDTDSFAEDGGAARLTSAGTTNETVFSTVGLRANADLAIGGRLLRSRGMVGWRHAEGDRTPISTFAFVSGSPFAVQGAPISKDAAIVEAGFSTELAPNVSLGLDYVGQFGDESTDNGFRIGLSARF